MSQTDYREYPDDDRPTCEVEVDGLWYPGRVHAWSARLAVRSSGWWAFVSWTRRPGEDRRDWFPARNVRDVPQPAAGAG